MAPVLVTNVFVSAIKIWLAATMTGEGHVFVAVVRGNCEDLIFRAVFVGVMEIVLGKESSVFSVM